jgi:hypothetical protein
LTKVQHRRPMADRLRRQKHRPSRKRNRKKRRALNALLICRFHELVFCVAADNVTKLD